MVVMVMAFFAVDTNNTDNVSNNTRIMSKNTNNDIDSNKEKIIITIAEVEVTKQIKSVIQCFGIPTFTAPRSEIAVMAMRLYLMMATKTTTTQTKFMKRNKLNTLKLQTFY